MNKSTIHNPVNFNPEDYEVIGHYDNNRPGYYGQPIGVWREEIKAWEMEFQSVYGDAWRKKINHCDHCGHSGHLRYIACIEHLPTGERITFGSSCVNRLGFKNKKEFEMARIRSRAEVTAVKIANYHKRQAFMEKNPGLQEVVEAFEADKVKNPFIKDVIYKLNRYGNLSERQVEAVITAWDRKKNSPVEPDRGPAPEGRQTIIGKILAYKCYENDWGVHEKIMVELENLSKVWVTIPKSLKDKVSEIKGKQIELTATFTASKDDKSFAYGKRPIAKFLEEGK